MTSGVVILEVTMIQPVKLPQYKKHFIVLKSAVGVGDELTINWDQRFQSIPRETSPNHNHLHQILLKAQGIMTKVFIQLYAKPRLCYPNDRDRTLFHHHGEPVSTHRRSNFEVPCSISTEQRGWIL
ncbi:hypothetical protein TNCV_1391181 [Trichonephila clavipes]|nr:hypothetical protein TNCV_1391181 [Trichonephila clavipes]